MREDGIWVTSYGALGHFALLISNIFIFFRSPWKLWSCESDILEFFLNIFSARCNIYILRLCYDVSVCLSVRLSVTEVNWRIIANLGFKFRSQFTAHCGRGACGRENWTTYSSVGAREGIIAGKSGGIISRYASHC